MSVEALPAIPERLEWSRRYLRRHPGRLLGAGFVLLLRYLYGLFYLGAALNKFSKGWITSGYGREVFTARLAEIDPASFGAAYLQHFALPYYPLVAWVLSFGELAVTVGLLLGLATRWAGAIALFLTINIGLGGYYDASLIPLGLIAVLFIVLPTGHWLGFDRALHARYPRAWAFR